MIEIPPIQWIFKESPTFQQGKTVSFLVSIHEAHQKPEIKLQKELQNSVPFERLATNGDLVPSRRSVPNRTCDDNDDKDGQIVKAINQNRFHIHPTSGSIKRSWNSVPEGSRNIAAKSSFDQGPNHSSSHINEIHLQTLS